MNATIEYILAGIIIILVFMTTEATISSLMNQQITALQQQNGFTNADNILDTLLLSPGDPVNWANNASKQPVSLGLADSNASSPYVIDPNKVARLQNSSLGYISPPEARSLLGLREDIQFSLTFTPVMTVNIQGNGSFTITVTDSHGALDPNVNVTAYYVLKDLSDGSYPSKSNITKIDGTCTIRFDYKPNHVLVVEAQSLGVRVIATSPSGLNYLPEGEIVLKSDTPLLTTLVYQTGYSSGPKESAQRLAVIGDQTYAVELDLWGD